jgi:hypothetical protein
MLGKNNNRLAEHWTESILIFFSYNLVSSQWKKSIRHMCNVRTGFIFLKRTLRNENNKGSIDFLYSLSVICFTKICNKKEQNIITCKLKIVVFSVSNSTKFEFSLVEKLPLLFEMILHHKRANVFLGCLINLGNLDPLNLKFPNPIYSFDCLANREEYAF